MVKMCKASYIEEATHKSAAISQHSHGIDVLHELGIKHIIHEVLAHKASKYEGLSRHAQPCPRLQQQQHKGDSRAMARKVAAKDTPAAQCTSSSMSKD
jgi:hypothetical protein